MALNKIDSTNLKDDLLVALSSPRITSIVYPGDDTAADPAGGQTITLKGGGFGYGAVVKVNGVNVAATTLVDFTTITFTGPAIAAGSYSLQVVNGDGGTATAAFSFVTSSVPTWSTASGSLGSRYEANTITPINLSANSDSAVTYSLTSGSLPGGLSLASNGQISGTLSTLASSTTYSFTIDAVDAELQNTSRSFTYTVNADSVTFTTSNNLTLNATSNSAITSNTIVATSAAGRTITFSSSSLPTGISINATSGAITGTPTVEGNTASIITATANATNKSANLTFNFIVSVAVPSNINAAMLIVAGGGGGGGFGSGGGGGAGGAVTGFATLQTSATYTVIVGAGGAGGAGNFVGTGYANGTIGSNSSISGTGYSNTTIGGGGGGSSYDYGVITGGAGGSGGGSNYYQQSVGGSGTPGQGNDGGRGGIITINGTNQGSGGGGGGAGAPGKNPPAGANGGIGIVSNIMDGVSRYYAGGGAGYMCVDTALGGGGSSARDGGLEPSIPRLDAINGTLNGTYNTGGGGGAWAGYPVYPSAKYSSAGSGGAGIVILSYPGSAKFTGGTITTVGSNTVHTFLSSGSLVPL